MNTTDLQLEAVNAEQAAALSSVFERSFAASEGEREGLLIAQLVGNILQTTANEDLFVFQARRGAKAIAATCLTRLCFATPGEAFLLSPVAVLPSQQRQGLGQALIQFAFASLRQHGTAWVYTYGDPAYYSKLGFEPANTEQAPYPLSQPVGWQAVALQADAETPQGKARCVSAFQKPELW